MHVVTRHSWGLYICQICEAWFNTREQLVDHITDERKTHSSCIIYDANYIEADLIPDELKNVKRPDMNKSPFYLSAARVPTEVYLALQFGYADIILDIRGVILDFYARLITPQWNFERDIYDELRSCTQYSKSIRLQLNYHVLTPVEYTETTYSSYYVKRWKKSIRYKTYGIKMYFNTDWNLRATAYEPDTFVGSVGFQNYLFYNDSVNVLTRTTNHYDPYIYCNRIYDDFGRVLPARVSILERMTEDELQSGDWPDLEIPDLIPIDELSEG